MWQKFSLHGVRVREVIPGSNFGSLRILGPLRYGMRICGRPLPEFLVDPRMLKVPDKSPANLDSASLSAPAIQQGPARTLEGPRSC